MITAWSPSRLNDYETCPAKAKYKYIDRLPEPPAPALDRGSRIHKEAETFILGTDRKPPADLARVKKELIRMRGAHRKGLAKVEQALALDEDWTPVDWFHRTAWLRCKIDVVEFSPPNPPTSRKTLIKSALITDWKTGRNNPRDGEKHGDQMNLYALTVISAGLAEQARARLIFTDSGEVVNRPEGTLDASQVLTAREKWRRRVDRMMKDKTFDPMPNFSCRWCAFSNLKGGPCKF